VNSELLNPLQGQPLARSAHRVGGNLVSLPHFLYLMKMRPSSWRRWGPFRQARAPR